MRKRSEEGREEGRSASPRKGRGRRGKVKGGRKAG